jgi:6-phosphogluconate dehydrogenase
VVAPMRCDRRGGVLMQLGMVGLGRMGANLVRRVVRAGHECVVFDRDPDAVAALTGEGITGAGSLAELAEALAPPRVVWVMVPAGAPTNAVIERLAGMLADGDIVVDGGNTYYRDDRRRAELLACGGIRLVDCGTSGGIWGLEEGYCLMLGGDSGAVEQLKPILTALAPGVVAAPRTSGRSGPVVECEQGWLHCGPVGAGHFAKMIHNGVEYGMMAALAEGLNILAHADLGTMTGCDGDVEIASTGESRRFAFDLPRIVEVWRRGSVIRSWLLDLTAAALHASPQLTEFSERVADSGEGRWTAITAIDEAVPAPVLTAALYSRFSSQHAATFADKVLSALRQQFGGHTDPAGQ